MGLRIRTVLLLGLLTGVIVLMGQLFGGRGGQHLHSVSLL